MLKKLIFSKDCFNNKTWFDMVVYKLKVKF